MITNNDIKFLRTLASKRGRTASQLFVAEGEKLVGELTALLEIKNKYVVGENCSEIQMAKISQLKTPTNVLATFKIPNTDISKTASLSEKVIVLDGVQDPGNLGTIIRTADWFGIKQIICSPDTVDVFGSKVVQATMGAIARVSVIYTNIEEWLDEREKNFPNSTYGTFLEKSDDYSTTPYHPNATIVMGNEGNGISEKIEKKISNRIHIKRGEGGCGESLNVAIATAIIVSRL